MGIDCMVGCCTQQKGAVRVHRIDFPISTAIGGEHHPFFTVVDDKIGPTFVGALGSRIKPASKVQGCRAVGVRYEYVPVAVPVAGKCDATAVWRPGRITVFSWVVCQVYRCIQGPQRSVDSIAKDFIMSVSIGYKGQLVPRGGDGGKFLISRFSRKS